MKVIRSVDTSHLATREGLTGLKSDVKEDISNFKADLKDDIANLATKDDLTKLEITTKESFTKLESTVNELSKDVSSIKTAVSDIKYDIIKWVVPLFLTSIGITLSLCS